MSRLWWTLTHPRHARKVRHLDARVTALEARMGDLEPLRQAVLDALAVGLTPEQITAAIQHVIGETR